MAVQDIYEVTLHQQLFGQQVENVYFYREDLDFVSTAPTKAQVLAENFVSQKLDRIRAVQTGDLLYTGIDVKNLMNDADAFSESLSLPGTASGGNDTLGSFEAWSYPLQGDNPSVRDGFKRLAGVVETWQTDGVFNGDGAQIASMTAAGTAMTEYVTVGLIIMDNVFRPVVVKRVRSGTPGNYTYDLPHVTADVHYSTIVTALFKLLVTSQISRKIGVGS
jgi:hypothetical protein